MASQNDHFNRALLGTCSTAHTVIRTDMIDFTLAYSANRAKIDTAATAYACLINFVYHSSFFR